mmetsp:Transcript_59430/g.135759  ORF Transcript_59430/g.135759 Transcript_59430/m.135759 type:complete len:208 (-) Transcript_59430:6-629(-)
MSRKVTAGAQPANHGSISRIRPGAPRNRLPGERSRADAGHGGGIHGADAAQHGEQPAAVPRRTHRRLRSPPVLERQRQQDPRGPFRVRPDERPRDPLSGKQRNRGLPRRPLQNQGAFVDRSGPQPDPAYSSGRDAHARADAPSPPREQHQTRRSPVYAPRPRNTPTGGPARQPDGHVLPADSEALENQAAQGPARPGVRSLKWPVGS